MLIFEEEKMNRRQKKKFKYTKLDHRRWHLSRKQINQLLGENIMNNCIKNWNLPIGRDENAKILTRPVSLNIPIHKAVVDAIREVSPVNIKNLSIHALTGSDGSAVAYAIEKRSKNYKTTSIYVMAKGENDDVFHMYSVLNIRGFHNPSTIMKYRKRKHH